MEDTTINDKLPRRDFLVNGAKVVGGGLTALLGVAGCAAYFSYRTQKARTKYSWIWRAYQSFKFDPNNLKNSEKWVLEGIHRRHGPGPIDVDRYTKGREEDWIRNFKYISGKDKLDDRDLLFIFYYSEPVVYSTQ